MKNDDIARRLAKQSRMRPSEAADQLDKVVHDILRDVRKGQDVKLPGLGKFKPGQIIKFQFDKPPQKGRK